MVLECTTVRVIFYSLIHIYLGDIFKLYSLLFLFVRIKGGLEIFFEKIVCFVYHCFVLFIYHGCFFLVGLYCDFLVDLYCYFFVNCRSSFSWSASATASSFSLIKLYLLNFCFQTLSWFQHLWMIFLTFFYVTLLLLFACVSQIR